MSVMSLSINQSFAAPKYKPIPKPKISKPLYLTFDDGPGIYTNELLDILKQNNSTATFCVLGSLVKSFPKTARRIANEGNTLCNHSWNHPDLSRRSYGNVYSQMRDTKNKIYSKTGVITKYMRPPYGASNSTVRRAANSLGMRLLFWDVDTNDWRYRNSNYVYNYVLSHAKKGKVILMHDIHYTTVRAMKRAIPELVRRGFTLVGLP